MIASVYPVELSDREVRALRLLAVDERARLDEALVENLLEKGMLRASWDHRLSPAGRHALHVGLPNAVDDLDD